MELCWWVFPTRELNNMPSINRAFAIFRNQFLGVHCNKMANINVHCRTYYKQTLRISNHNITFKREVNNMFSVDSECPTVGNLGINEHLCLPNACFVITFNIQHWNFWFRPPFFCVTWTPTTISYGRSHKVKSLVPSTRKLFIVEVLHHFDQFTRSGGKQRNVWWYILIFTCSHRLYNMNHLGTQKFQAFHNK